MFWSRLALLVRVMIYGWMIALWRFGKLLSSVLPHTMRTSAKDTAGMPPNRSSSVRPARSTAGLTALPPRSRAGGDL